LLEAAQALEAAERESTRAIHARDLAVAFKDAVEAYRSSHAAQAAAVQVRDTAAVQVHAADAELRDAQAASARAVGPALRAWIAARGDCDRAEEARRDEIALAADNERAEEMRQSVEAAAKSATRQTMLLSGAAGAGVAL